MKLAVNPDTSVKKKPRGKPFTGKDDPRNNVVGAPKRGESWAELIKKYGDMTPQEAAQNIVAVAKQLKPFGNEITLKEAVVVRVYAALLFEPNASLLNAFMERAEGKVTEPIDLTSKGDKIGTDDEYRTAILSKLANIAATRRASDIPSTAE